MLDIAPHCLPLLLRVRLFIASCCSYIAPNCALGADQETEVDMGIPEQRSPATEPSCTRLLSSQLWQAAGWHQSGKMHPFLLFDFICRP